MPLDDNGQLLLVRCSTDACDNELSIVQALCGMNDIQCTLVDKTKRQNIATVTAGMACFDMVYLCGHGSIHGFGGTQCQTWDDVSSDLCNAACMADDSTMFCACCRGGLKTAAKAFFENCNSLAYVIGPRNDTYGPSIALGFHTLMYNVLFRHGSVEESIEKAYTATGHLFNFHDRQQMQDDNEIEII